MARRSTSAQENPWKIATIGLGLGLALLVITGIVMARGDTDDAGDQSGPAPAVAARPAPRDVEDCNRYAAGTGRDTGRIVKDALIGGAVGAGVGAASGAIVDGGDAAGEGAGVGGLVGVAAGTLYGLHEENRKSEAAQRAYRECMARRGY
jgi:hypothetical protein